MTIAKDASRSTWCKRPHTIVTTIHIFLPNVNNLYPRSLTRTSKHEMSIYLPKVREIYLCQTVWFLVLGSPWLHSKLVSEVVDQVLEAASSCQCKQYTVIHSTTHERSQEIITFFKITNNARFCLSVCVG